MGKYTSSRKLPPTKGELRYFVIFQKVTLGCMVILTAERMNKFQNKKVLLHERKRHTARRVSSTPPAILSWGGYPILGWVVSLSGWGVPHLWMGGTPSLDEEGTPSLAGVPPIWTWLGYPMSGPGWGTPPLQDLPGVLPIWTWLEYPPPGVNRLKTLLSPSFGCGQ